MSVDAYWCLMVPTGVCRRIWVFEGAYGASECLWASEDAFWCVRLCTGV